MTDSETKEAPVGCFKAEVLRVFEENTEGMPIGVLAPSVQLGKAGFTAIKIKAHTKDFVTFEGTGLSAPYPFITVRWSAIQGLCHNG
ncbi:MAG: hypothetical protein LPL29_15020 [Alphaproteobacteria bacterium]|nr:hypothetical protein [Alphaproteobacteria bacterium]